MLVSVTPLRVVAPAAVPEIRRVSVPAPPLRISPEFKVTVVEPEPNAVNVSLPDVPVRLSKPVVSVIARYSPIPL